MIFAAAIGVAGAGAGAACNALVGNEDGVWVPALGPGGADGGCKSPGGLAPGRIDHFEANSTTVVWVDGNGSVLRVVP